VLVGGELGLEQEVLVVEDHFGVDVFDEDPEGFGGAVELLVPLKVRRDGQLDTKSGPEGKATVNFKKKRKDGKK